MRRSPRLAILLAFDRSGSSMTARILGSLPGVNLLFQPFNGTEVSRSQWEVWDESFESPRTARFLRQLEEGNLDEGYIQSEWFRRYSSSSRVDPLALNLIKDTKLQFKVRWLQTRFPSVRIVGLWRDPIWIMESLVRNGFVDTWYGYLTEAMLVAAASATGLIETYADAFGALRERKDFVALGLALRTHYHLLNTPPRDWVRYESLVGSPAIEGRRLAALLGTGFATGGLDVTHDYNVAGEAYTGSRDLRQTLSTEDIEVLQRILAPVCDLASRTLVDETAGQPST